MFQSFGEHSFKYVDLWSFPVRPSQMVPQLKEHSKGTLHTSQRCALTSLEACSPSNRFPLCSDFHLKQPRATSLDLISRSRSNRPSLCVFIPQVSIFVRTVKDTNVAGGMKLSEVGMSVSMDTPIEKYI